MENVVSRNTIVLWSKFKPHPQNRIFITWRVRCVLITIFSHFNECHSFVPFLAILGEEFYNNERSLLPFWIILMSETSFYHFEQFLRVRLIFFHCFIILTCFYHFKRFLQVEFNFTILSQFYNKFYNEGNCMWHHGSICTVMFLIRPYTLSLL